MIAKYKFAQIILITIVNAQIDGEFWWLNKKLDMYREAPPPPKFENISELETDETNKIVFKEDNDVKGFGNKKSKITFMFQDRSEIVWPDNAKQDVSLEISAKSTQKEGVNATTNKRKPKSDEDVLEFKFPDDDNFIWMDSLTTKSPKPSVSNINSTKITKNEKNKITNKHEKQPIKVYEQDQGLGETENICTFIKKSECNKQGAVIYYNERNFKRSFGSRLVCCILPISQDDNSQLYFPDNLPKKRIKRSETQTNSALKQREALLLRKYGSRSHMQNTKLTSAVKTKNQKIVSTANEEYIDPYLNIKSSNFKKPNKEYNYDSDDYVEDYIVEFPSPGLTSLYSDYSTKPPVWSSGNVGNGNQGSTYGNTFDEVDEDKGTSFGYGATIDPRLDRLSTASIRSPIRGRPAQIFTSTEQYDAESQTISYQSHPDFHVLHGYKLLNLVRNKSRIYNKKTPESITGESKETVLTTSLETDYSDPSEDDFDVEDQEYEKCEGAINEKYDEDRQTGDAPRGSHPWLALVVLTRRRQTMLCYASLVHSRAAVTAADCVHDKTTSGEVTLVAGAWDLGDETHEGWQKRMATVYIHQSYRPSEFAHDLAILHWKRPLRLGVSVQPVCLADPHVGDDCKFFGWGGYDRAIRPRSKWQRASILMHRACSERLRKRALPKNAFCATVRSRGIVSGVGGPLVCSMNGHTGAGAVGVAIWREGAVVLIPAREWTQRALDHLGLL